jgi:hypothetical protein
MKKALKRLVWDWLGYGNGLPMNRYDLDQWWKATWMKAQESQRLDMQTRQAHLIEHLGAMMDKHHCETPDREEERFEIAVKVLAGLATKVEDTLEISELAKLADSYAAALLIVRDGREKAAQGR